MNRHAFSCRCDDCATDEQNWLVEREIDNRPMPHHDDHLFDDFYRCSVCGERLGRTCTCTREQDLKGARY